MYTAQIRSVSRFSTFPGRTRHIEVFTLFRRSSQPWIIGKKLNNSCDLEISYSYHNPLIIPTPGLQKVQHFFLAGFCSQFLLLKSA